MNTLEEFRHPRGLVVVVNGQPRAGKDTFIALVRATLSRDHDVASSEYHCIESIKTWLSAQYGVDVEPKTEAKRNLWAEIAASLEKCGERISKRTYVECMSALRLMAARSSDMLDKPYGIVFVHMREPERIERVREHLRPHGIKLVTVVIKRPAAMDVRSATLNSSDAGTADLVWDYEVENNRGLEHLVGLASGWAFNFTRMVNEAVV